MQPIHSDMIISSRGFTLIEAVIVIVITGIIGGFVAVFIKAPVDAYFDSARRAEMTDIADTALRRMARDVRLALPNSVRVTASGGSIFMEFLQTRSGARYRQDDACFAAGCSSLTTFGSVTPEVAIAVNSDRIAIYNQYNNEAGGCGDTDPSAYCGTNTAVITGLTDSGSEDIIGFAARPPFPHASPSNRFQIIETPVSYVCTPGAGGTGTLRRYWGYAISPTQPTAFGSGGTALLATRVSACNFNYAPGITERGGLLNMRLTLSQASEDVSLQNQVHVTNVP